MERLYFQYQPADESLGKLLGVQHEAQQAYGGKKIDPNQLHLTLLHVGIVQSLYGAVHKAAPKITLNAFESNLETMSNTITHEFPDQLDVQLVGYKRFDPSHSTFAAMIRPDKQLMEVQATSVTLLKDCLSFSGIANPSEFIAGNGSLRYALDYEPHISLLWEAGRAAIVPELQETLHMELVPPSYDLKHGRYTGYAP